MILSNDPIHPEVVDRRWSVKKTPVLESLTETFFYEFWKTFKGTFFNGTTPVLASKEVDKMYK